MPLKQLGAWPAALEACWLISLNFSKRLYISDTFSTCGPSRLTSHGPFCPSKRLCCTRGAFTGSLPLPTCGGARALAKGGVPEGIQDRYHSEQQQEQVTMENPCPKQLHVTLQGPWYP